METIRTRFAPSPTGYMHIGNLRTALYAYLVAKKSKDGVFILRIEDTDQERLVEGAVDIIYNTLKECHLQHDEGPDIGGDYGPYVQSERMKSGIYKEYALKLVEMGKAHICFCTEEDIKSQKEVAEAKGESFIYRDPCKKLSKEEIETRIKNGEPYVIRQNIDPNGTTSFEDEVYGTVTVENEILDEMILLKSDGYPTYNFANVIDDHLMGITDVVRGNEYLSSTPKYNLIYEALGWNCPRYIHCPPVMKDEHQKLSKRNGDASFQDLVAKGYLPEAILNYIALLGWAPDKTDENGKIIEVYSLEELCQAFNVKRINKTGAIFDIEKLKWMNGVYLREMDFDKYLDLVTPYIKQSVHKNYDLTKIAEILKERVTLLNDIPEMVDFIDDLPEYSNDLYYHKKMKVNPEISLSSLKETYKYLSGDIIWDKEHLHDGLINLVKELGIKNGQLLFPVRVALSGKAFTPGGAIELADIFGKEETLRRLSIAIEKLENAQ